MAKQDNQGNAEKAEFDLFWADQLADKIIHRNKYRYLNKTFGKPEEFVVKTSASISGVLHIGRLSDTARGASAYRALKDAGEKARFIWVAEDMDPLRKIPAGVPASYEAYIGMSVSTLPDPEGCHKSYADHHTDEYFKVLNNFVFEPMERFSMQEEYRKGNFNDYIKKLLDHSDTIREIQNKQRTNPLKKEWSPWTPVCANCGKIVTPRVKYTGDKTVTYTCQDYLFETTIAKGCGYKGEADPLKDPGKMAWKSEWAAQWSRWKISTEGAGKEYQVPNSAFWINAEICERILDFPSPEPIFYEHLTIDGVKMSASLGNVVYPRQWLEVAPPQLLRFFYNKRLMTSRSFSWKELPLLYDEFDKAASIYFDKTVVENEKERSQIKRLYAISNKPGSVEVPSDLSFSHAAMVAQIFDREDDVVASLEKTGQYKKEQHAQIMERIRLARAWIRGYAPDEAKYILQTAVTGETKSKLSPTQLEALRTLAKKLKSKKWEEKELYNECYSIAKEAGIQPPEFFKAAYLVLLNKERGPKLASFLLVLGERAVKLLEQV